MKLFIAFFAFLQEKEGEKIRRKLDLVTHAESKIIMHERYPTQYSPVPMQTYTVNRGGIGRVVCMTFFGAIGFLGAVSRDVKEVGHSGEQKKTQH